MTDDAGAADFGCDDFFAHALAVLNEDAPAGVAAAVEAHAASCRSCAEVWKIAHETSCKELADFLDDYVAETLPAEKREVFDRHLGVCPECVAYVDSYRRTIELAQDAESVPCDGLPPALVAAILDAQRRAARGEGGEESGA